MYYPPLETLSLSVYCCPVSHFQNASSGVSWFDGIDTPESEPPSLSDGAGVMAFS